MAGAAKARGDAGGDLYSCVESHTFEMLQCVESVILGVERQGGPMPRIAPPVGELGVLLLEMAAVRKQQLAEFGRGARRDDPPFPANANQPRGRSGMIEVRVREENGFDVIDLGRRRRPIESPELPATLEQSAIHQYSRRIVFEKVARSRHGSAGAKETDRKSMSGRTRLYVKSRLRFDAGEEMSAGLVLRAVLLVLVHGRCLPKSWF